MLRDSHRREKGSRGKEHLYRDLEQVKQCFNGVGTIDFLKIKVYLENLKHYFKKECYRLICDELMKILNQLPFTLLIDRDDNLIKKINLFFLNEDKNLLFYTLENHLPVLEVIEKRFPFKKIYRDFQKRLKTGLCSIFLIAVNEDIDKTIEGSKTSKLGNSIVSSRFNSVIRMKDLYIDYLIWKEDNSEILTKAFTIGKNKMSQKQIESKFEKRYLELISAGFNGGRLRSHIESIYKLNYE